MSDQSKVCAACKKINNSKFLKCWKCGQSFPDVENGYMPPARDSKVIKPLNLVCMIAGLLLVLVGLASIALIFPIIISTAGPADRPGDKEAFVAFPFWFGAASLLLGMLVLFLNRSIQKNRTEEKVAELLS